MAPRHTLSPLYVSSNASHHTQIAKPGYIIDGALALSQVALILLVPRTLKPAQQRVAIYIWCLTTVLLYSVLISIFKIKNGCEYCLPMVGFCQTDNHSLRRSLPIPLIVLIMYTKRSGYI